LAVLDVLGVAVELRREVHHLECRRRSGPESVAGPLRQRRKGAHERRALAMRSRFMLNQLRGRIVLFCLFRVAGWACVVTLIVLSLAPGNERPHTWLPGQIEHVIAYCATAALLGLGYPTAKARFGLVAMLALLAAVLEMTQLWIPDRHSQFIGFAASFAGACLGMLAVMVVDRFGPLPLPAQDKPR
jgi:hypothetical protein